MLLAFDEVLFDIHPLRVEGSGCRRVEDNDGRSVFAMELPPVVPFFGVGAVDVIGENGGAVFAVGLVNV